jgi:hypothetical protein
MSERQALEAKIQAATQKAHECEREALRALHWASSSMPGALDFSKSNETRAGWWDAYSVALAVHRSRMSERAACLLAAAEWSKELAALDTIGPSFLPRQGGARTVQQDGLDGLPTNLDPKGNRL